MTIRRAILIAVSLPGVVGADGMAARLDLASDSFFRGFRENDGLSAAARIDYGFGGAPYLAASAANDRAIGDARLDLVAGLGRSLQFQGYVPYRVDGGISGAIFTGGSGGPFHRNPDYAEAYGSLSVGPLSGSFAASPDYFATGAVGYRLGAALRLPLAPGWMFRAQAGWSGGGGVSRYVAARTSGAHAHPYFDYGATLTWSLPRGFSVYAQMAGTSLSRDRAPRGLVGLRKDFDF